MNKENKYGLNKIALTGATSTLGTAIIRECIVNGIQVLAFVNKNSPNEKRIPKSELVRKVYCSLDEFENFSCNGLSADALFHLAWGHTNRQLRNAIKPQIDNIKYSIDSVMLAYKLQCTVYVGAGSQAEYGRTNEVLNENSVVNPETAYGMAKLCSGQMTRMECKKYGIKHIWPRILSTYGPYTQDTTILNYTIKCLLNKEKPSLTRCEQVWDFIYVDDAARALLLLANKGNDGGVYCVSSGLSRTLREFVEITKEKMNSNIEIGFGDLAYEDNTVMHLVGDISKLKKDTGFEPLVSFEEGIQKTIEWAKEHYKNN